MVWPQGYMAVGPDAAHIFILVAQKAQQDGHRLAHCDRAVGMEHPVGIAGDDALALGRHIDIRRRPVGGLHIGEYRHRPVKAQLAFAVHGVDRHFAELRPGQHAAGTERAVGIAVQHAHEPQRLHGHDRFLVLDVGKAYGLGRLRREHQRRGRQTHRHEQTYHSFFHIDSPSHSARRASTG